MKGSEGEGTGEGGEGLLAEGCQYEGFEKGKGAVQRLRAKEAEAEVPLLV